MSMSLEERRAERRRRRQMEEEASSVATVNGEDDFERKRRERREARLRASGDTDYSSTNDYSSRRNRRRGTEEDLEETPVVNEEPVSSVPDTSEEDAAEERRRRQRQEEEEESRRQAEREAEEERERQAALEEERQREEEERQRQREEERRLEEERQRQEEEEERQRQGNDADDESGSERSLDDERYKLQRSENKLFIDEDRYLGKRDTDNEKKVNVSSKLDIKIVQSEPKVSDRINKFGNSVNNEKNYEKSLSLDRGVSLEVNNNKIKDKLNKFEHLKDESDSLNKTKDKGLIIPIVEKDGFKGKLKKFETEIREQETTSTGQNTKSVMLTPQTHKLSEKLQHFEMAAKSQSASRPTSRNIQYELQKIGSTQNQRKALLGRWSASETHINKPEVRDMPKRNVLDRWKSVEKSPQESVTMRTPTQKKEVLTKRLSGNTEFIASKYLEKASKSIDESSSPPPKTPTSGLQKHSFSQSFDHRLSSPPTETRSGYSNETSNQSRSKVTSRWSREDGNIDTPYSSTPSRHYSGSSVERNGRDSSFDDSAHSRGSSIDETSGLARKLSCQQQEEEEEAERERLRQEQEEQEKAARMAAEEGQKKRGKRKGLGGLTPEKKKKLKQIIMQKAAEDLKKEALAKAQEKEKFINDRVGPLNTEGLGEAELRKLIKGLHEKLAQIHSESYDIEFKLNKQEKELVDLNMKISDSRGKFAKPVLRKVNKTEQKFAALAKKQEAKDDFRETLKSVQDDDEPAE